MRIQRIIGQGVQALNTNKVRTLFMMAGTIVGIAALTVIMAIGSGTEKKIMKRVEGFGPRALMLIAGGGKDLPPPDFNITTLRLDDADAVRNRVQGIEAISPVAFKSQMPIKVGGTQTQATVFAVDSDWHEAWDWYVTEGDPIAAEDVATLARVCVIGQTLSHDLFGNESPIGEYIHIQNVRFRVKGILKRRGTSPIGTDFDNRALIPLTTGMRRLFNQDHITYVRIKVRDLDQVESVKSQVRQLIHERHHITPPEEDDFRIVSAKGIGDLARGTSKTLSILLSALAGLSLIVGGVVLMNILLISVGERQKEIGLRRAVGATRKDILFQFLTESLAVTSIGMLVGSGLGAAITLILKQTTKVPVVLSWEPFALSLAFALLVGIFFGVQPARKAASLNPVETLR
ncbi:MAG: FtsX-like permease family protein [Deltaproteobacteria bacterium]|nr:FtsX-like permease family protein [Deltaproteobacteria bacterium]